MKKLTLLFFLLFVSSAWGQRLHFADFETGTLEGYSTLPEPNGAVPSTLIPDENGNPNYSIRAHHNVGGDKLLRTFGSLVNIPEVVFRYKYYTPSWDTCESIKFFRWRGTTAEDNPYGEMFFNEGSSPCYYFGGVFRDTNNVTSSIGSLDGAWSTLTEPRWQDIVVRMVYNTPGNSDGIIQAWIDGILRYSLSNKNYRYSTSEYADAFSFIGNPGTSADMANSYTHVDDIEIFDRMPRNYSSVPVNLNPSASGATNVHYNRGNKRMVRFGDTVIILVAEASSSENTYRSTDGGLSWSLIDSDLAQAGALISGPNGYVYHFFRSGTTLRMTRYLYNATTIPAPTTIFTDADIALNSVGLYRSSAATIDSTGRLYFAENWVNSATGEQTIYLITSSDNGATWSAKREVSYNINGVHWLYQDMDCMIDDTLVVSYGMWDTANHQFQNYVAISSNYGVTWTRHLVGSVSYVYNPSLLVVGDNTIYVFAQSGLADPMKGLVFSKSTNKGVSFTPWARIDQTCEYADPSAAVGEDGSIFVTYRTNNFTGAPTDGSCGDRMREALIKSTDGGITWSRVDTYFDQERVGTKSHLRYQTHFSYGGPMDWMWMQYTNSEANLPTFFDSCDDVHLATDGGEDILPPNSTPTPIPDPTPTPTPIPDPTPIPTPIPDPTPTPPPSFINKVKGGNFYN